MTIFICTANVKSVNPALTTTLKGYQFLSREYRAETKEQALQGFTEYLKNNKQITEFNNIVVM